MSNNRYWINTDIFWYVLQTQHDVVEDIVITNNGRGGIGCKIGKRSYRGGGKLKLKSRMFSLTKFEASI